MSWRRSSDYYGYYPRYPRSRPRAVRGGIKAQTKRGSFGETWWAKRWIAVLESFNIGARLSRGRSYARGGQVLSISIQKGKVAAKVQGSRPKPYEIAIRLKVLKPFEWKKLVSALATQAIFTAKLLAGEMPSDIESVFKEAKLSLWPEKLDDLKTSCSCPDWSNPCKHVAAVFYLLGEEFDRDPFLLFKLRGMEREELMPFLGNSKGTGDEEKEGQKEATAPSGAAPEKAAASSEAHSLSVERDLFWNGGELPEDFFGEVEPPRVSAAPVKRLGNFPFWRGEEALIDTLEANYKKASEKGLNVFLAGR